MPLILLVFFVAGTANYAFAAGAIRAWGAPRADLQAELSPGQWNLVVIWSVTCTICAAETPGLSDFHDNPGTPSVRVLGLSIDGANAETAVAAWMREHKMRFPTLLADIRDVATYLVGVAGEDLLGTPTFLLFNPTGELVGMNHGPLRIDKLRAFIARKSRT